MNQLKKYNYIFAIGSFGFAIVLVILILPIFCIQSNAFTNSIDAPSNYGGEVYNVEDFVYALGGDEVAYSDSNTIIFRSDVVIETPIIIKSGEYILQGSGCYMYFASNDNGEALIIIDGEDVILTLGSDKGSDDHPSLTLYGNDDNAIKIYNGTLNIYTGTLFYGFTVSPIHMVDGYINMYGGVFRENNVENGGAFYIENGELYILQGSFYDNTAENGGVIYSENGNIIFVVPDMNNNTAKNGGVIYLLKGELLINSGSYQYNEANDGGVIYSNVCEVSIGGGTFAYNKATDGGGVIFNSAGGELLILNHNSTSMLFNEADIGAVVYNMSYVELHDAQITYNTAQTAGGGIANFGELIMYGGSISMNESKGYAGGIANYGTFEMYEGSVSSNKASDYAQGILNDDAIVLGEHCFISFNNDVYMQTNSTIEVTKELTANTPVATLTLPKYTKGVQIVTGNEEALTSASEKIAISDTGKGTWYLDTEGKLQYESDPLSLPYIIVIALSAVAVIVIIIILTVHIKKKRKES